MSESTDELAPWPREGEVWVAALPWPEHECPAGMYVHTCVTAAGTGLVWALPDPRPRARAVCAAWELRYGHADMQHPGQRAFAAEAVVVEAVGAEWIYVRSFSTGRRETIPAHDMHLGFRRVDGVEIIEHGYGEDEPVVTHPRVPVDQLAAALAPLLELDASPDREDIREAAAELLIKGVLQFEGDPSISIRICL